MKAFGVGLLVVVGLLALSWIAQGNDFFLYKVFAPKVVAVQRQTFEQSKSYRQGMVQELENMRWQYIEADSSGKAAMRALVLHRAADVPPDAMPADLAEWVSDLRRAQ